MSYPYVQSAGTSSSVAAYLDLRHLTLLAYGHGNGGATGQRPQHLDVCDVELDNCLRCGYAHAHAER